MNSLRYHTRLFQPVLSLYIALTALLIISFWNRYIFTNSNLPFVLIILIMAVIISGCYRFHKKLVFSWVSFSILTFIIYMVIRLDGTFPAHIKTLNDWEPDLSGIPEITNQLIFFGIFIVSAILYYNKKKFSLGLWFLICGYMFAFIFRISTTTGGFGAYVKYSHNPAIVMFTLLPFIFYLEFEKKNKMRYLPHLIFAFVVYWLFLLHARTALASCLIFYLVLLSWPVFTKNRFRFYVTFFGVLSFIFVLFALYFTITKMEIGETIHEYSRLIFSKSLFTRSTLWTLLLPIIQEQPLFGFGTGSSSSILEAPDWYWQRINISSHSTYLEVMLRLGVFGLIIFLTIFFYIWKTFWDGRNENATRVAGSFLIASLFFICSSHYWIFGLPLRSGFGWAILGIGFGASLRAKQK